LMFLKAEFSVEKARVSSEQNCRQEEASKTMEFDSGESRTMSYGHCYSQFGRNCRIELSISSCRTNVKRSANPDAWRLCSKGDSKQPMCSFQSGNSSRSL
jgi:hypothetical protein